MFQAFITLYCEVWGSKGPFEGGRKTVLLCGHLEGVDKEHLGIGFHTRVLNTCCGLISHIQEVFSKEQKESLLKKEVESLLLSFLT